jgi:hypothetical protein
MMLLLRGSSVKRLTVFGTKGRGRVGRGGNAEPIRRLALGDAAADDLKALNVTEPAN